MSHRPNHDPGDEDTLAWEEPGPPLLAELWPRLPKVTKERPRMLLVGDHGPASYTSLLFPIVRQRVAALLADDLINIQPMRAEVPFEIHVLTPEEIAKAAEGHFECVAYMPHRESWGGDPKHWVKGRLRATRTDGEHPVWQLGFWEDAPLLCGCLPVIDGQVWGWGNNHPGFYSPIPEGTSLVTIQLVEEHHVLNHAFALAPDDEVRMRAKLNTFPPREPAGPLYGGG